MSDIVEFLRARLDEDEAVARAATPGPWRWLPPSGESFPQSDEALISTRDEWEVCGAFCYWSGTSSPTSRGEKRTPGRHEHLVYSDVVAGWGYDASGTEAEQSDRDHIARHDPARVLREVEAKRRIVRLHPCDDCGAGDDPCNTLCVLASVYSDHPDYDPKWRA